MKLPWELARRYLAPRRGGAFLSFITWIALGGVTVGVTALIVVIAVMTGAQEDFQEKILDANAHVVVQVHSTSLRMANWRPVLEQVREFDGVVSATPFLLTKVVLTLDEYSQSADLYGIDMESLGDAATGIEARIKSGGLALEGTESGLPPLLVGDALANRMFVFPGDTLIVGSLESFQANPLGGLYPSLRQFEMTGTFSTGLYDYDIGNLYAPMSAVQDLLGLAESDEVSGIGVMAEDPWSATELAREIRDTLGFPFWTQSWAETNSALFSALKLEKLAMGLILFLIVVVAAFNIVSTLVMVVVDRTREIGILKSMGMTDGGVLRVFMFQGVWIGVIGATVGTLLGCILSWILETYEIIRIPPEVYFFDRLPVALHPLDVVLIYLATVAVAFAATIYPALQASRLEPVEAIRHD
jgi:lipoprotein-releasing system permease protein